MNEPKPPKPKFPFKPDCKVRALSEIIPARYIGRVKGCLSYAWVQIDAPPGVFSVSCVDVL